jgi:group I intron endonuclease
MIGIYKITNPDNYVYIGQSVNIHKRIMRYKRLENVIKSQTFLYRSLVKYGFDAHNIEVVCECSKEELNNKERYYQDFYNDLGYKLMNLRFTTSNDKSGSLSEDTKIKIGKSNKYKLVGEKGIWYGKYGKNHPAFGNRHSDEYKLKMSINNMGENNPQYGKIGNLSPNYGTGRIIQQFNKSNIFIQEGDCNYFKSLKLLNAHVYDCCNGNRKSANGYIWRYK